MVFAERFEKYFKFFEPFLLISRIYGVKNKKGETI